MIKRIFGILAIALPLLASAQQYPIVKDSAIWREVSFYLISPPYQFGMYRYQYLMQGDTLIKGEVYKKVYSTDYDSLIYNPIYVAAMREDSLGRVFVLYDPSIVTTVPFGVFDTSECLLYDFSLTPGDTFLVTGLGYDSVRIVDYIDSVYIAGDWRRQIHFVQQSLPNRVWIEGIGSMKGLFFPHQFEFENLNQLICYEDKVIYWTHPNVNYPCLTVGMDEPGQDKEPDDLRLFPNPACTELYFDGGNSDKVVRAFIHDTYGRLVIRVPDEEVKRSQIKVSALSPGVHIVEFWLKNGTRMSRKLIKQ